MRSIQKIQAKANDTHAKKLNDLFVAYVYSCDGKSKKEKKELLETFNRDWVDHCYSINKIIGGNTLAGNALRLMAKDKNFVAIVREGLGLAPEKTFLQKLLS